MVTKSFSLRRVEAAAAAVDDDCNQAACSVRGVLVSGLQPMLDLLTVYLT